MKKLQLYVLVLCACLTSGCATAIKYNYNKSLYKAEETKNFSIVVDQFQDVRSDDEHMGTFSTTEGFLYTKDKLFKKDIDTQVSEQLIKHFEKSALFEKVVLLDFHEDLLNQPTEMQSLKDQGFDIAVQGDLFHFYGYQQNASTMGVVLVGILGEAMFNRKIVGGRAAYGDLQIIDLSAQTLLWEGALDYDFERKETFYDGAQAYAIESLKYLNDQLIRKMDEVLP